MAFAPSPNWDLDVILPGGPAGAAFAASTCPRRAARWGKALQV